MPVATVLHVLRSRVRCVMCQSRVSSLTQVVVDDESGRLLSSRIVTLRTTQSISFVICLSISSIYFHFLIALCTCRRKPELRFRELGLFVP